MGFISNLRGLRSGPTQETLPLPNGVATPQKKKWTSLMPLCVGLVVIAEIAFLGRLDMGKNTGKVDFITDWLYWSSEFVSVGDDLGSEVLAAEQFGESSSKSESCEEWLEREDAVTYSRNFTKEPIFVVGRDEEFKSCSVGCKFGFGDIENPDATFGSQRSDVPRVLRSMESAQYYAENNIETARWKGYSIVMTTSLSSDVPVGYFSWAEYDIMAPPKHKSEISLAAAFISNCGARNFRLQALEELEKSNITIDSYGGCHRNHDGNVDKLETLTRYKFSLAFENSNEEDYVTEKFFQSLVAGSIPVVVGAPNIQDFAPAAGSILHIKQLSDVKSVAKRMRYLSENPEAYNRSLRWKFEGPSDSFKALVDMAAVHSSCRLCIHLATMMREKEETSHGFKTRPCKCTQGPKTVYHLYARERGRFEMESIFLRSDNLTLQSLESATLMKFKSLNHTPIWKPERPESIRGGDELIIYRIYPFSLTQRKALYSFRFKDDMELKSHLDNNPCAKFEVIFV